RIVPISQPCGRCPGSRWRAASEPSTPRVPPAALGQARTRGSAARASPTLPAQPGPPLLLPLSGRGPGRAALGPGRRPRRLPRAAAAPRRPVLPGEPGARGRDELLRFVRADGDLTLLWAEWQGRRPEWELTDMVIWVTGASSGIGEELVYQLSKLGVSLVLSARRVQELERVKRRCLDRHSGQQWWTIPAFFVCSASHDREEARKDCYCE
uniref:Dehydrogenase/reductase 7 n=1 Tax=Canis lupus familiaris TaxID=9615 RepID=A0A8C0PGQ5_CANLF